jgi:hypothetical protein
MFLPDYPGSRNSQFGYKAMRFLRAPLSRSQANSRNRAREGMPPGKANSLREGKYTPEEPE